MSTSYLQISIHTISQFFQLRYLTISIGTTFRFKKSKTTKIILIDMAFQVKKKRLKRIRQICLHKNEIYLPIKKHQTKL